MWPPVWGDGWCCGRPSVQDELSDSNQQSQFSLVISEEGPWVLFFLFIPPSPPCFHRPVFLPNTPWNGGGVPPPLLSPEKPSEKTKEEREPFLGISTVRLFFFVFSLYTIAISHHSISSAGVEWLYTVNHIRNLKRWKTTKIRQYMFYFFFTRWIKVWEIFAVLLHIS